MIKKFTISLLTILMVISSGLNAHFNFMEPFKYSFQFTYAFNSEIKEAGSVGNWFANQKFNDAEGRPLAAKDLVFRIEDHEKNLNAEKRSVFIDLCCQHGIWIVGSIPAVIVGTACFIGSCMTQESAGNKVLAGLLPFGMGLATPYLGYRFIKEIGDIDEDQRAYQEIKQSLESLKELKVVINNK